MASRTPVTKLDQRYSSPGAEPASWEDTLRVLEEAELFWLTTVRADGRPHVTPVVAVWGEGGIHFHTGATEQKYLNLQANPHIVLTTGAATWDRGLDVVVEGPAVRITDKPTLERLAPLWKDKWDGRWQLNAREGGFFEDVNDDEGSAVFSVAPTKIYAHAKGEPFGATTHRF
jgi:nitroimidazol reductase NimA-like FMN-containing flavoprotein (pyridoxamine 5'-phosphate oxidase superfamily)